MYDFLQRDYTHEGRIRTHRQPQDVCALCLKRRHVAADCPQLLDPGEVPGVTSRAAQLDAPLDGEYTPVDNTGESRLLTKLLQTDLFDIPQSSTVSESVSRFEVISGE